jgi:hypothetical protein
MEGLFFVIKEIYFSKNIDYVSILLTIIFWVILWKIWDLRDTKKLNWLTTIQNKYSFTPIDPDDSNYVILILAEIRRYIAITHAPMHTWSHTPIDIKTYFTDMESIEKIEHLENKLYSGEKISLEEAENINKFFVQHFSK